MAGVTATAARPTPTALIACRRLIILLFLSITTILMVLTIASKLHARENEWEHTHFSIPEIVSEELRLQGTDNFLLV